MFNSKIIASLLGVMGVLAGSTCASAQVFLDNFDGEALGLNQSLDNWAVSDGTIDVIGTGFFDLRPPRFRYLDMDGSTSNAGKITTNQVFAAGNYILSFDLSGNGRNSAMDTVRISLGGYSESISLAGTDPFATYVRNVNVAAPSQLIFDHAGGDNIGLLLDNVVVREANAAVPEPSALLYGLALAPVGLALRRRFRK